MGYKAYAGRIINFISPEEVEYFPLGILIIDEKGKIIDYGERRKLLEKYKNSVCSVEDFGECLIMPGFVDTHLHLSHYGIDVEEVNLESWLKVIYQEEENFKFLEYAEMVTRGFFNYIIANGITTICVHTSYFKEATEIAFEEAKKLCLNAIMGMVMADDPNLPENLNKRPEQALQEAKEIIKKWHRPEENLFYALTPRSAWSCSPGFLTKIKTIKEEYNCYFQTHLGECTWVLEQVKTKWSKQSDTLYFYKMGLLSSHTIVAHGVYLQNTDKDILKKEGVGISHNPASDAVTLKNQNTHFELDDLLDKRIPIGLGADEPWNLPVFNVMRKAKEIQENKRKKCFPASLYFYLYTLGGARCLGLESTCGSFKQGKRGDFIVLDVANFVRKRGILDDPNELLETLLSKGDTSIIVRVYTNGKKVLEPPKKDKENVQRLAQESLWLLLTFGEEMLHEFKEIRRDFRERKIRPIIESSLDRIFNLRFESITEIFRNISWIAGVFYSEELPPKERFINVFKLPPFRSLHLCVKSRKIVELHSLVFGSSGLYQEWARQGKIIPVFEIFLSPPTLSSETGRVFPWLPKPVVFVRSGQELPFGGSVPLIDLRGLIPESELASVARRTLFLTRTGSGKDRLEQMLEKLTQRVIKKRTVGDRLRNILKELALILDKPELTKVEPTRLLRTIMLLTVHDDEWQCYYYFPARVVPWEAVGGFAIATRKPLPAEFINVWANLTDVLFSPLTILDRERKFLRQALRSAVAAIMARNMSHNIGSHVLAYLQMEKMIELFARVITNSPDKTRKIKDFCNKLESFADRFGQCLRSIHNEPDIGKITKEIENDLQDAERKLNDLMGSEIRWGIVEWVRDTQDFFQYLQHRMDFLAQVSTEWPEWTFPAYFMKDMMRYFLSQRHLLDGIAKSDGFRGFYYDWEKPYEHYLKCKPEEEKMSRIKFHVFNLGRIGPEDDSVRKRRIEKWFSTIDSDDKGSLVEKRKQDVEELSNKRILLYSQEGNTLLHLEEGDVQFAIPGGIIGYHAFFSIIENIIRNSAKHGERETNKDLEIIVEIIDDFESNKEWRVRIYDNVSFYKKDAELKSIGSGKETKVRPIIDDEVESPEEGLIAYINKCLRTPLIEETGELRKESWGLAEMKICAGYLQMRDIRRIGAEGDDITGGEEDIAKGDFVIRAVLSPLGTLGYEFKVKKPKEVGIVCHSGGK